MYNKASFVAGRIYQRFVDMNFLTTSCQLSHGVDNKTDIAEVVNILTSLIPDVKISTQILECGYELTITGRCSHEPMLQEL